MDHIVTYYPHDLNGAEIKYCDNLLSKDEACLSKRLERLEHIYEHAQDNPRECDHHELVSGVSYAPLLLGCAQFGNLISAHITLIHHELQSRGTDFHAHNVNSRGRSTLIGGSFGHAHVL